MKTKITKNFSLEEFTATETGFLNIPTYQAVINLTLLCVNVLQPARDKINKKITIISGYRCKKVNRYVGGKYNSQHLIAEAADIVCDDLMELYKAIESTGNYDQLIIERSKKTGFQWIHVSWSKNKNRKMTFKLVKDDNKEFAN